MLLYHVLDFVDIAPRLFGFVEERQCILPALLGATLLELQCPQITNFIGIILLIQFPNLGEKCVPVTVCPIGKLASFTDQLFDERKVTSRRRHHRLTPKKSLIREAALPGFRKSRNYPAQHPANTLMKHTPFRRRPFCAILPVYPNDADGPLDASTDDQAVIQGYEGQRPQNFHARAVACEEQFDDVRQYSTSMTSFMRLAIDNASAEMIESSAASTVCAAH